MNVDILNAPDADVDAFVERQPDAKIGHTFAWSEKVIQRAGHRPFYLVARDGDEVCGVLPLTQVRSILFGNHMISQAFSSYGGPLTSRPEALKPLYDRAVELATAHGCESIEFRNVEPLPYDLQLRHDKVVIHLQLPADPQELWGSFKPKIRNHVRKAEKSGILAASGSVQFLGDFYRVYTIRMHQLGTPPRPKGCIRDILTGFPANSKIFVVRLKGEVIGAGLTICYNGCVEIPLAATLPQYNKLCPNNLLYWSIMKHYCGAGADKFDFGRSTVGGSTHRFKEQWGSESVQLNYQYWVRGGGQVSILSPEDPKYRKRVEMWKKLPLWLTRLIGPYISKQLP